MSIMFPHTKPPTGTQINPLHPLSKGLVGYWLFNEGAGSLSQDISGNENHGRLTNMAPNVQGSGWGGSKFGGGLEFDGEDDYVDCGNDASLDITGAITVGAWFNQKSQAEHKGIVSKWGGIVANRSWYLLSILITGESYHRFKVQDASDVEYAARNPLPISLNTWYHVVGVYDGSDIILYVDGTEVDSVGAGTSLKSVPVNLIIGALGGLPTDYASLEMDGSIDSVHIYNRGLSAEEVKTLYLDPFCNLMQRTPSGLYVPTVGGLSIPVAMHHYNQLVVA